jgi:hypothetical protein
VLLDLLQDEMAEAYGNMRFRSPYRQATELAALVLEQPSVHFAVLGMRVTFGVCRSALLQFAFVRPPCCPLGCVVSRCDGGL